MSPEELRQTEEVFRDLRPEQSQADAVGGERFMSYLATKGLDDLYFFNRCILGFKDATNVHREMCEFSQRPDVLRKGFLIPRSHMKSYMNTIGKRLWVAIKEPESRALILHEKAGTAEEFLSVIASHCMQNELLRALYPERVPPNPIPKGWKWKQDEIVLPRANHYPEPTIMALGVSAAMQGKHFTDATFDDLIGEEAAGNSELMQKMIDRLARIESISVVPSTWVLDVIGTRWAYWDIYQWMMDGGYETMQWFKRSAIVTDRNGNDVPLWPERFTMEGLMELRKRDFFTFSAQYMNEPVASRTSEFAPDWFRYYRKETNRGEAIVIQDEVREGDGSADCKLANMTILMHVDPGLGITEGRQKAVARHSRSTIVVVGIAWPRRAFILHVWAEMEGLPELCNQILRFFRAYDRQIQCISIEKHSWTRMVKPTLLEEARKQSVLLTEGRIHDFTKSGNTQKDVRIRSLQPFFAKGMIFMERGMVELERELRDFPLGKTKDIIDALSQGSSENLWRFPEEEEASPWHENEDQPEEEMDKYLLGASPVCGY